MKSRLKFFTVMMVLVLAFLTACGSNSSNSSNSGDANGASGGTREGKKLKIALVTSAGGLGDKSYNDLGYEGLKKVELVYGMETKVVEPKDISEGEKYLTELARAGYDLVITLEYGHADILKNVAPQFPDTRFSIFNIEVDEPNVTSVLFKEHEGSFLAGALAAMVTADTSIPGMNAEKKIGVIGGTESPGIDKFIVGYEEGAKYIDESVEVIKSYANSFEDPAKGKEMALVQIGQGADIVYQVAGGTGIGIIEAAKEKGVFAIGVDSDQDYLAEGFVLTSMMKRVDNAVIELAKYLQEGTLDNVSVLTLGLKESGVDLSPMTYTKDKIPSGYLEKIAQIRNDIIEGKIQVTDITQN
jgi:basic membrane protein A